MDIDHDGRQWTSIMMDSNGRQLQWTAMDVDYNEQWLR
jgi:hypothetical protein